jgi:hypothetical protein
VRPSTKRTLKLITVTSTAEEVVLFSVWIAVLHEIRADCRVHSLTYLLTRSCAPVLVRMLVAAACIQTLAACARRPVQPEAAALASTVRAPNPLPRRTHIEEAGCQLPLIGLGDTWPNTDAAPARMNYERPCYGPQKSSCAAECGGRPRPGR